MNEIIRNMNRLREPFRSLALKLHSALKAAGLHLEPFETLRTMSRQEELVKKKVSRTLKSRHLVGQACDFVVYGKGGWSWGERDVDFDGQTEDEKAEYIKMGDIIAEKFPELEWGGSWKGSWDKAHVQLRAT